MDLITHPYPNPDAGGFLRWTLNSMQWRNMGVAVSLATRLYVQQLAQANSKKIKALNYWPFLGECNPPHQLICGKTLMYQEICADWRVSIKKIIFGMTWRHHQIEMLFAFIDTMWGESTDHGGFSTQRVSDANHWCFLCKHIYISPKSSTFKGIQLTFNTVSSIWLCGISKTYDATGCIC